MIDARLKAWNASCSDAQWEIVDCALSCNWVRFEQIDVEFVMHATGEDRELIVQTLQTFYREIMNAN